MTSKFKPGDTVYFKGFATAAWRYKVLSVGHKVSDGNAVLLEYISTPPGKEKYIGTHHLASESEYVKVTKKVKYDQWRIYGTSPYDRYRVGTYVRGTESFSTEAEVLADLTKHGIHVLSIVRDTQEFEIDEQ